MIENKFFNSLFMGNACLKTDSYKFTHFLQMVNGTEHVVSYLEARKGGRFPATVMYGLQPRVMEIANFRITKEQVIAADWVTGQHFGKPGYFNKEGWMDIVSEFGGKPPYNIRAVKEGTVVEEGNVLAVFENYGGKRFAWLTQYLESYLMHTWLGTTVATNSFFSKLIIDKFNRETSNNPEYTPFALHDFGYRGVSSEETAGYAGSAHLTCFYGTDNIAAINYANKYYNPEVYEMTADNYTEKYKMYGYSIPASEHSVATPYGDGRGEYRYLTAMLKAFPNQDFSVVIDSFDTMNFIDTVVPAFKEDIEARSNKVVFRPDSGYPPEIVVKILESLWKTFGGKYVNGYKVLHPNVRVIQGDGIDYQMIIDVLSAIKTAGFAAENCVFGSGGGLLQKHNRDTQRFAIKCCYMVAQGQSMNVVKKPRTDPSKNSKSGLLLLTPCYEGANAPVKYMTVSSADGYEAWGSYEDVLEPVLINGDIVRVQTFDEIRNIVANTKIDIEWENIGL